MNRYSYYGEKKVHETSCSAAPSIQHFPHQLNHPGNPTVKQEKSNDGHHGNLNMIHIMNRPESGCRKPSIFNQNDPSKRTDEMPMDLSCVKREPRDVNTTQINLPSLDVPRANFHLQRTTYDQPSIPAPFKKIGEIVTIYQDVIPPCDIKNEPPSDFDTVPTLVPPTNNKDSTNSNVNTQDGRPNFTSLKSCNSPSEEFTPITEKNDTSESHRTSPVESPLEEQHHSEPEWTYHSPSSTSGESSTSSLESPSSSQQKSTPKGKHRCEHAGCRRSFSSTKGRTLHMNRCKYRLSTQEVISKDATDPDDNSGDASKVPGQFYSCPECGKTFEVPNLLMMHSLTHNDKFPFTCTEDSCDTAFKTEGELASHKATHAKMKTFSCPVFGCHKVFRSRQGYKVHSIVHMSEKDLPHICDKCGKQFRTSGLLKQHLDNTHGDPRPCPICNKVFNNASALRQHQLVHSEERPHSCPNVDCDKTFKCRGDLKRHMMLHSKLRAFICPYENCGKSCQMKGDLKKHMVVHSDAKPLECLECGKFFKNGEHLRKHKYHHTSEKPDGNPAQKRYHCNVEGCGKSFPVPIKLRRHEARHKEEKPYACPECPRAFKVDEDLSIHLRRIHGSGDSRRKWSRDPQPGVMTVLPVSSEAINNLSEGKFKTPVERDQTPGTSEPHRATSPAEEIDSHE